jgi:hypothetical protein
MSAADAPGLSVASTICRLNSTEKLGRLDRLDCAALSTIASTIHLVDTKVAKLNEDI